MGKSSERQTVSGREDFLSQKQWKGHLGRVGVFMQRLENYLTEIQ